MSPIVSVICPTYGRGRLLDATIASVVAQTEQRWELIVVDDASPDDTAHVAEAWAARDARIRVIRRRIRSGHPATPRNVGADVAAADVLAYLDHDDTWREDHLSVALGAMVSSNASAVACGYEHVDAAGTVVTASNHLEMVWHEQLQELGPLFEPSRVVVRAAAVARAGGWRAGAGLEDWDLWMRLIDNGERFATSVERTVRLLQDAATRRYSTPRHHRIPVGSFPSPAGADACRRELLGPEAAPELMAAALADVTEWLTTLERAGTLVLPLGAADDVAAILRATDRSDFSSAFREYQILQRSSRFELSLPVWTATRAHAERVERRLREVHVRQLARIADAVRRWGGEPVTAAGATAQAG